jgi:predicted alpha/beta-hydrolase family hydrolase
MKAAMTVAVGADSITALYEDPTEPSPRRIVFVCAHGAGGNMMDRGMLATANALRAEGLGVLRFNFPYKERKSGRPDSMPKLKETVAAVVEQARRELDPDVLIMGGRSMGGRAASMLAADGFDADGLLLLAYPLHPAGKLEKLRDAHLSAIGMPALCINGTRDTLCTKSIMEEVFASLGANWHLQWEEGADHSFHVLKSSGRTDADVMKSIASCSAKWVRAL